MREAAGRAVALRVEGDSHAIQTLKRQRTNLRAALGRSQDARDHVPPGAVPVLTKIGEGGANLIDVDHVSAAGDQGARNGVERFGAPGDRSQRINDLVRHASDEAARVYCHFGGVTNLAVATSAENPASGVTPAELAERHAIAFGVGSQRAMQREPDLAWTFDPNNRAVAGAYDFIGVAVHEIGHNWFQSMLASNEFEEPLLDEGPAGLSVVYAIPGVGFDVIVNADHLLSWGVDVAVSTPRLMTALVEEAVSVGDLVRLMTFGQSEASLVELTMPDDAPLVGQRVGGIDWPADTSLVAILREGRVLVPQPDDPLQAGDELFFVTSEDVEDELGRLLSSD